MSNTTKTGTPSQDSAQQPVSLRALVWAGLAIGLAVFVATQVIGVLYAILFPPDGPALPLDISLISHRSEGPGVDYWVYGTDQNACEVMRFFSTQDGTCQLVPLMCGGSDGTTLAESTPAQQVGSCTGTMNFSIFQMRWSVNVSAHHYTGGTTHFSLLREVLWTGAMPAETATATP
ncbi:MAG: hypothetical protein U0694_24355 [Anaerolineae bacterium]